jgi:hypothetical protein
VKKILVIGIILSALLLTGCPGEVNTPKIELLGSTTVTLKIGDTYVEPGYKATDKEDGDITDEVVVSGWNKTTTTTGSHILIYTVEDSDGHERSEERKIVVDVAVN